MVRLAHPHRGAVRAQVRGDAHTGETLIEIMVSIIIMGTAIVAILSAVSTMIIQSASHRGQVRTGNEATYVAELIQNATYNNCETTASGYSGAWGPGNTNGYTVPSGYTITINSITYLASRGGPTVDPPYVPSFQASCGVDLGAQQITITVKANSGGNRLTSKLVFVKWRKT